MINNECKTLLRKGIVANKGEQAIALRGEIDSLYAECIYACCMAKSAKSDCLEGLAEISKVVGRLMRCEALCESMEFCGVFGYSCEELREISHHPEKHLGIGYFWPDENSSLLMAEINKLRAAIRRCEREAARTYPGEEPWQVSIVECLNRLSSAVYIMMLKLHLEENKNDD